MNKMGISKDKECFGEFIPQQVLIWLDGPRSFTLLDADKQLCFAHWLQEVGGQWSYVVVPISEQDLNELNNGEQAILDVLRQPRIYIVVVDDALSVQSVSLITWDDLPKDALPKPGTMIRRELEPFFRLKSIGETIRPGDIPGSVIKTTVENAQKTIRLLVEYEMNHPSRKGKRSKALRELYDLPAQKLQAASFEVSFRSPFSHPSLFDNMPPSELADDKTVIDRVCEHLRIGISWLESDFDNELIEKSNLDTGLKNRILEAIKYLTPPTNGAIQKTQVSGKAFKADRIFELNRSDRRRVIVQQKQAAGDIQPKAFVGSGTIIDILGDAAEISVDFISKLIGQRNCVFSDELWEVYGETLHYNQVIEVYGVTSTSKEPIKVLEISFPGHSSDLALKGE